MDGFDCETTPMNESQHVLDIAKGELENEERDMEHLRGLSDRERGEMILAVCRAAAKIQVGRLKSGLPLATRDPWPESIWEALRKQAAYAGKT
jgi:hypothetical protein